MSVFSVDSYGKSIRDLTKESATFMWFQFLLDILLRLPQNTAAKTELLHECRLSYKDNIVEQKKIDEFENDYTSDRCIWWYTRDSFFYRLLNKAFRTEDIDIIFKFRLLITDLYRQVEQLHAEYLKENTDDVLTVYRGQGISLDELKKFQENIGGLVSLNSFLSSTKSSEVALEFAGEKSINNPFVEPVVLQMEINLNAKTKPFANVQKFSYMKDEGEILISMGTVFKIESVEQLPSGHWFIELTLSELENKKVKDVIEHYQKQIGETPSLLTLGSFLMDMAEYGKAKRYYKMVLEELSPTDHKTRGRIYNALGLIYRRTGNFDLSLKMFRKALRFEFIEEIYHNIGTVYLEKGNYKRALRYCKYALKSVRKMRGSDHHSLVESYQDIGTIYRLTGRYRLALENSVKALLLDLKYLPKNHPDLAISYLNVGMAYFENGQYEIALGYFEDVLKIQQMILTPYHPSLATTHASMGTCYRQEGEYTRALKCFEKALEIEHKTLPHNHPTTAKTYNAIGMLYRHTAEYDKALSNFEKALEIQLMSLDSSHSDISESYNNIGLIHWLSNGDTTVAVQNYRKAIDIQLKNSPLNHRFLAVIYNNLGLVYEFTNRLKAALRCYEKALQMALKSSSMQMMVKFAVKVGGLPISEYKKNIQLVKKKINEYKSK
ncbi:unnamed protein product [Didymodactylos carnosus]|nr:unnamed protein product [Didymodactylos carnosus]CAF3758281.1 unnamed protein product [Didymodactylos carnosus]